MGRISVRDTGKGIDPTLLHAIFGMFVQGKDPLQRPAAGLGVGLALTRSLVELHHGTVEARSEGVGKGSEFIISLPLLSPELITDSSAKKSPVRLSALAEVERSPARCEASMISTQRSTGSLFGEIRCRTPSSSTSAAVPGAGSA